MKLATRVPARGKPSPLSIATQAPVRKAVDRVELHLPMPPSANRLWRPVPGGMACTSTYNAWKFHAGIELVRQRPGRIPGRYTMRLLLGKLGARADVDNRVKPVSDLLEAHGVVANDRLAQDVSVWRNSAPGEGVVVIVESLPDCEAR